MAKKASKGSVTRPPRRYGSLIRVSDEFANAINDAAASRKISVRDYADEVLMTIVQKTYREDILAAAAKIEKEMKKLEGGGK